VVRWLGREGVEVAITIAAKSHTPRLLVLDRKIESVKFNRTIIVTGELTNGKKIAHESRGNQNVSEVKSGLGRRQCGGATAYDRNGAAVANRDARGRRGKTGQKYTIRGRHVSCGTGVEDPRGGPLERHLVQSGDEAGLIPAALLLRRWSGGRSAGELGGGERGVGLG